MKRQFIATLARCLAIATFSLGADVLEAGMPFEEAPINYNETKARDAVMKVKYRMAKGDLELKYDEQFGYLPALLKALEVPLSSQTLVFAKTSLQLRYISPRNPRALYFADDVYVGWVRGSNIMELSTVDPRLGAVFYAVEQNPDKPRILRKTYECLQCHASTLTQGVPGHSIRSVFPKPDGTPNLRAGTYRTDHKSPLEERWGGWYVTGTHGDQKHMGNAFLRGTEDARDLDTRRSMNVTSLADRFPTAAWMSPHSDLIALMVLEHQAQMHNFVTRANFDGRRALYEEKIINKMLKEPNRPRSESIKRRFDNAADRVLRYMLFSGEAALTGRLRGTSGFEDEFPKQGPRDCQGRSLRDFDLTKRVFKYPCSYVIYTESFDALPAPVAERIYRGLYDVLTGKDQSEEFAHLSPEARQAILEILLATKKGLPDYWTGKATQVAPLLPAGS
ncbi:MAG: hypothetical protein CMJ48_05290 [Planctomycetaceae bacterium]|nr:hypothetical protein [Planctomycetaceae bacterium]